MKGYKAIALKIPDRVRAILTSESDPIGNATAAAGDKNLQLLSRIWHEFIETHAPVNLECAKCRETLRSNFKELKPVLKEIEAEHNSLKELRQRYGCEESRNKATQ
jgi:bacterioferritin-associated ferredoxin